MNGWIYTKTSLITQDSLLRHNNDGVIMTSKKPYKSQILRFGELRTSPLTEFFTNIYQAWHVND